MATITRLGLVPALRHLRAEPTMFIQHLANGKVAHQGSGEAFWFRPRVAAISQVPLEDREQTLLFHARTADFQEIVVQATVTYRIIDPALATTRIDFGIDPKTGNWTGMPLDALGGLLTELAQQPALELLGRVEMRDALATGIGKVRAAMTEALQLDDRLTERGITVTDVRVVAIKADAELERAMQTETRERVQQDADRATYERRAQAVERERAIAENELQNKIELAKREEHLLEQRGLNEQRRATDEAAAERITYEATATKRRLNATVEAETIQGLGAARAEAERARLAAFEGVDTAVLNAQALQALAANLPQIQNLTVTPDMLTDVLTKLTTGDPGTK